MITYPISFSANISSDAETETSWDVHSSAHSAGCAIPKEFGGPGGALSPEDFFLLALSNCFVATFKVYAKASKLTFASINVQSELVLDKVSATQPMAKACHLQISVDGVSDASRILTLLKKVARSGILLNSVKTEIHFDYSINGEKVV
jgi:organic hydroperoxide reductase OsmC/OhrA